MSRSAHLRSQILALTREYQAEAFAGQPFVPGQTPVPVSGKVFDGDEIMALIDPNLDFWLTTGRHATSF